MTQNAPYSGQNPHAPYEPTNAPEAGSVTIESLSPELRELIESDIRVRETLHEQELKAEGTVTINSELGSFHRIKLAANCTGFTITNPPAAGKTQVLHVLFAGDEEGHLLLPTGWPASIAFGGGTLSNETGKCLPPGWDAVNNEVGVSVWWDPVIKIWRQLESNTYQALRTVEGFGEGRNILDAGQGESAFRKNQLVEGTSTIQDLLVQNQFSQQQGTFSLAWYNKETESWKVEENQGPNFIANTLASGGNQKVELPTGTTAPLGVSGGRTFTIYKQGTHTVEIKTNGPDVFSNGAKTITLAGGNREYVTLYQDSEEYTGGSGGKVPVWHIIGHNAVPGEEKELSEAEFKTGHAYQNTSIGLQIVRVKFTAAGELKGLEPTVKVATKATEPTEAGEVEEHLVEGAAKTVFTRRYPLVAGEWLRVDVSEGLTITKATVVQGA